MEEAHERGRTDTHPDRGSTLEWPTGSSTGARGKPPVSSQTFDASAKLSGDESLTVTDVNGQRFKAHYADQFRSVDRPRRERSRTFRVVTSIASKARHHPPSRHRRGGGRRDGDASGHARLRCGFRVRVLRSIAFYPLFGGGGAAIGAVVDALITKTLFTRTSGAVHLAVQPMPRGAAVQMRMTF